MSKSNGGPAFPRPIGNNGRPNFEDSEVSPDQEGMSQRDYFAAKTLQGDWASTPEEFATDCPRNVLEKRAALYYRMADAMIAEREK
jgi:hypothetical protein